ncbi:hypothetical protein OF83DRAFT_1104506, partial [Amylostereum chailletii]
IYCGSVSSPEGDFRSRTTTLNDVNPCVCSHIAMPPRKYHPFLSQRALWRLPSSRAVEILEVFTKSMSSSPKCPSACGSDLVSDGPHPYGLWIEH